jgi:hypothetical protein
LVAKEFFITFLIKNHMPPKSIRAKGKLLLTNKMLKKKRRRGGSQTIAGLAGLKCQKNRAPMKDAGRASKMRQMGRGKMFGIPKPWIQI